MSAGVTNADIDEAKRQLRQEAGGHEPYALAVYPRAQEIAQRREEAMRAETRQEG